MDNMNKKESGRRWLLLPQSEEETRNYQSMSLSFFIYSSGTCVCHVHFTAELHLVLWLASLCL